MKRSCGSLAESSASKGNLRSSEPSVILNRKMTVVKQILTRGMNWVQLRMLGVVFANIPAWNEPEPVFSLGALDFPLLGNP